MLQQSCRVGFVRQIAADMLSTLSKNSDLSDALWWIRHELGCKKWQCSNAVIPTLGLICLYSSLTTLFPPEILSPITIHKLSQG